MSGGYPYQFLLTRLDIGEKRSEMFEHVNWRLLKTDIFIGLRRRKIPNIGTRSSELDGRFLMNHLNEIMEKLNWDTSLLFEVEATLPEKAKK